MGSDEVHELAEHISEHRLAGSLVINYDDETIQANVNEDCTCGPDGACSFCGGEKDHPPLSDTESNPVHNA